MLSSYIKDRRIKIWASYVLFRMNKNVTIWTNFIADEKFFFKSELILFRMNNKFYHPN